MTCPKCGTANMYDNTSNKRNPRSPDYKCRNKECGHGIWTTPKPNGNRAPSPLQVPINASGSSWNALAMTYRRCWAIAGKVVGADSPDRVAATATLFIESNKRGLSAEAPKPAPPPPPPPPPVEDFDPALMGDADDEDY